MMLTDVEFAHGLSLSILKTPDRHVNNVKNVIYTTGISNNNYTL